MMNLFHSPEVTFQLVPPVEGKFTIQNQSEFACLTHFFLYRSPIPPLENIDDVAHSPKKG